MISFGLPWFMYDITNFQLITTSTIPTDIHDSKDVLLAEVPIVGLNYAPVQPAGNGNRKLSFTLPLMRKDNNIGNSLLLQQFHMLRNQATGIKQIFSNQFTPNPKVLYYWGTGSLPLIWYVKKCDLTNKQGWVNRVGQPQYSEVSIELWLDENDPLYRAEEIYRKIASITGSILNVTDPLSGGKKF